MDGNTIAIVIVTIATFIIGLVVRGNKEENKEQWRAIQSIQERQWATGEKIARVESKADSNEQTVQGIRGDLQKLNDKLDRLLERKP